MPTRPLLQRFVPHRILIPLLLAGCNAPPPEPAGCSHEVRWYVPQNSRILIDLLFVVDDSAGMGPPQERLIAGLPTLIDTLANQVGHFVDLHIGVVTTDMGAGATGAPGCAVAPGPGGRLRPRGAAAPPGCQPPVGNDFIVYEFWEGNTGPNNLPPGQDLRTTLACMLAAGESGCPFPQPLTAARAALTHPDFVRDDAELAIVILTNHDDGSAPPDTDLFDATKTAQYGHLDRYARQTRAGVVCGSPPIAPPYAASSGPIADCAAAPNPDGRGPGRLDDVGLLDRLITTPRAAGGLKSFPRLDRIVVFAGPASPFEVILADPDLPPSAPLPACAPLSESPPACVPRLRPSCRGADPRFAAEPAVRLAGALVGTPHPFLRQFESICDADYAGVLASLFVSPFCLSCGGGCVPEPLAPDPLHPECHAEDVTQNADGSQTTIRLERCIDPDPRGDDAPPCWRVEPTDRCWVLSPDGVRLRVDRHGRPAPAHTVSWFTCSTTC